MLFKDYKFDLIRFLSVLVWSCDSKIGEIILDFFLILKFMIIWVNCYIMYLV